MNDESVFGNEDFNGKLLRLIAHTFPDYRIWVDIRNLYTLTERRIRVLFDSSGSGAVASDNGDDLPIWFDCNKCLAACALRVGYPKLTRRIINNEKLGDGQSFRGLVSEYIYGNGDVKKQTVMMRYSPFMWECIQGRWFDVRYPLYLIDWEGSLTSAAWLVMEPAYSAKKPIGADEYETVSRWDDVSDIPFNENDFRSAVRWYSNDVLKRVTSNGGLLLAAMTVHVESGRKDIDDMELRRDNIYIKIAKDVDKSYGELRESYRRDYQSLLVSDSYVKSGVMGNVRYAFKHLRRNDIKRLRTDVIDRIFQKEPGYIRNQIFEQLTSSRVSISRREPVI